MNILDCGSSFAAPNACCLSRLLFVEAALLVSPIYPRTILSDFQPTSYIQFHQFVDWRSCRRWLKDPSTPKECTVCCSSP